MPALLAAWMPAWLEGYVLVFLLLGAATLITVSVPFHGQWRLLINTMFLLCIGVGAWKGGFVPGVITVLYTEMVAPRLVVHTFKLSQVNWVSTFEVVLISLLLSWAASSQRRLKRSNEELDARVRERTAELEELNRELQRRETRLVEQTEQLAQSNADLEQFAYIASHDLQEPLRMVSIYTELFAQQFHGSIDEHADRHIQTIIEGAQRMETLLRDLLAYSHTIHAEQRPPETFGSAEAVEVAMSRLEVPLRETGAKVKVESLPEIHGDRVGLTQVFQNLMSNALKYRSPENCEIRIAAQPDGEWWILSVEDNGIGIHGDYHETIFKPFKRLHGREYRGSGVGLAICRRIVERQGGRIWVESEPGRGAKFRFTIRAARPSGQTRTEPKGQAVAF